jgi:hypothetical protein
VGYRWLDVYCGGCRHVKAVDLAAVAMHPQARLTSLILMHEIGRPREGPANQGPAVVALRNPAGGSGLYR